MVCPGCFSAEIDYADRICPFCARQTTEQEWQTFLASLPAPYRARQEELFEHALREGGG